MKIIKVGQLVHKTIMSNGMKWVVFAKVEDYGILVEQHGFHFYTKKEALNFINQNK